MLISTTLVLMMLIPGLALFYGGLVRKENVLATVMQSFSTCCVVSITWVVLGYSLAFTEGSALIGGFGRALLNGMEMKTLAPLATNIPESVYVMFQLTFAAITSALILGAVADRIKFSATVLFAAIWSIMVYAPVAHWVWGPGGFLGGTGVTDFKGFLGLGAVLDFAGGSVVHINAGIAGLMAAIVLGRRRDGVEEHYPHNIVLSAIGASLLWVGWFGFNAGSAVASNGRAGMAMFVTQFATAVAALAWMFTEWITKGKPSVLGIASGAVAGLVAITPASGFVGAFGAMVIGIAAGIGCFFAATTVKGWFRYDDSLDAFGVHCVGGIIGALLTGVLNVRAISGVDGSLLIQAGAVATTLLVSGIGSFILLKILDMTIGLRVSEEQEREGLDLALHGETVQ
jgi:Amt family ammonium transporter